MFRLVGAWANEWMNECLCLVWYALRIIFTCRWLVSFFSETNTVSAMHSSISTTAFHLFIYIWIFSFGTYTEALPSHVSLVFAHSAVQTSLRIQFDVEQINSVHRCVSPIQWHILEFKTQRRRSLCLWRVFFHFFLFLLLLRFSLSSYIWWLAGWELSMCIINMMVQPNT